MVTIRSLALTSLMSARNNVVFPDPVPPAITMLRLALTAAAKKSSSVSSNNPRKVTTAALRELSGCTIDHTVTTWPYRTGGSAPPLESSDANTKCTRSPSASVGGKSPTSTAVEVSASPVASGSRICNIDG